MKLLATVTMKARQRKRSEKTAKNQEVPWNVMDEAHATVENVIVLMNILENIAHDLNITVALNSHETKDSLICFKSMYYKTMISLDLFEI